RCDRPYLPVNEPGGIYSRRELWFCRPAPDAGAGGAEIARRAGALLGRQKKSGFRELFQQEFQVFHTELLYEAVAIADKVSGQLLFLFLQPNDLFFDAVAAHHFISEDIPGLANAMASVNGLLLHSGVPPGIEQKNIPGRGKVETGVSCHQTDQEDVDPVVFILEVVDHFHSLTGGGASVEMIVVDA